MASTAHFDPFLVSEELDLRVIGFDDVADATQLQFRKVELGDPPIEVSYDLTSTDWSRVRVAVELHVPMASLKVVVGGREPSGVAGALVDVECRSTKVRRSASLEHVGDGRWRGSVVLDRMSLANVVRLLPRIALEVDLDHGTTRSDLATRFGEVVATGLPVLLRVDHVTPMLRGGLDVRWEDFRASSVAWRKTHDADPYSMDFGAPEPVLWLNERYVNLKSVMHGEGRTPLDVAMKRVAIALVGQGAWHQLFATATAELGGSGEDDTLTEAPGGWRGAVLDKLLPGVYPDHPKAQRLSLLLADLGPEAAPGALATRLGSAIQAEMKVGDALLEAVRAVERETDA